MSQVKPLTVSILISIARSANHVYLLEPVMNPAAEAQAVGRSHRMGQSRPVTVTRLYIKVRRRLTGVLCVIAVVGVQPETFLCQRVVKI